MNLFITQLIAILNDEKIFNDRNRMESKYVGKFQILASKDHLTNRLELEETHNLLINIDNK